MWYQDWRKQILSDHISESNNIKCSRNKLLANTMLIRLDGLLNVKFMILSAIRTIIEMYLALHFFFSLSKISLKILNGECSVLTVSAFSVL